MCPQQNRTYWSREQIRAARRAELPPLLRAHGFELAETGAGNYIIRRHPDIVVKQSFWRSTHDDRAGNAIDFFMRVLGMSFSEAMEAIAKK